MNLANTSLLAFGLPAAPEWIFIGILALVLFGPKKLPSLARGLAEILSEFQKAKQEFHREICELPPLPKIQEPAEKKPFQGASVSSRSEELSNQEKLANEELKGSTPAMPPQADNPSSQSV